MSTTHDDEQYIWEMGADGSFNVLKDTAHQHDEARRGTMVICYLKEDQTEFLDTHRLEDLVKKLSMLIGFPIALYAPDPGLGIETTTNEMTYMSAQPNFYLKIIPDQTNYTITFEVPGIGCNAHDDEQYIWEILKKKPSELIGSPHQLYDAQGNVQYDRRAYEKASLPTPPTEEEREMEEWMKKHSEIIHFPASPYVEQSKEKDETDSEDEPELEPSAVAGMELLISVLGDGVDAASLPMLRVLAQQLDHGEDVEDELVDLLERANVT